MTTVNINTYNQGLIKKIEVDGKFVCYPEGIEAIGDDQTEYGTPYVSGKHRGVGRFEIQGGKAFGGSARDWWVDFPEYDSMGTVPCTSRLDAIRLVNNL